MWNVINTNTIYWKMHPQDPSLVAKAIALHVHSIHHHLSGALVEDLFLQWRIWSTHSWDSLVAKALDLSIPIHHHLSGLLIEDLILIL